MARGEHTENHTGRLVGRATPRIAQLMAGRTGTSVEYAQQQLNAYRSNRNDVVNGQPNNGSSEWYMKSDQESLNNILRTRNW